VSADSGCVERQSHLPYPAGVVEFVEDPAEQVDVALLEEAHAAYRELSTLPPTVNSARTF
jgi:hypothetical protein